MGGHHNSANLLDGLGSLGVSAATGTQLVGVDGVESMTPKVQLETTTADPLFGTCPMAAMAISDCGPMPCLTEEYELPWISRIYHQTQLEYHTDFISLFYTLDIYKYIVLVYIYTYIYIY